MSFFATFCMLRTSNIQRAKNNNGITMKTKFLIILLSVCSIGLLSGCKFAMNMKPSKTIITRTYKVGHFNAIDFAAIGNVEFIQSKDSTCSISIKGPQNYVKQFEVGVDNGILHVDHNQKNHFYKVNIQIRISAPMLTNIQSKGVGDIHIANIQVKSLEVLNKGVGNINIDSIIGNSITINSNGVGNINIKGKVHVASLACNGVGDIKAEELQSKIVDANCRGVGSITCFATDSMTASVKGVGSIKYKGKPLFTDLNSSGVGSIKEK